MHRNRIMAKSQPRTPPIVPYTARGWLVPFGRSMLGALFLLGCALAFAIGRQAHLLGVAAGRDD